MMLPVLPIKRLSSPSAGFIALLLAGLWSSTPLLAQGQVVSPYTQVSAGSGFTSFAVRADGTLWSWGSNSDGLLGTGATAAFLPTPQQVALPTGVGPGVRWTECSGGSMHALGLTSDGQLWAWGTNYGLLGTGNTTTSSSRPVRVSTPAGIQWRNCSAASEYSAAIRTDGTLWQWGKTPLSSGYVNTPQAVPPPATAAAGTTWTSVSAGMYHALALRSDGTLWAWGRNTYGAVGDGTLTNRPVPVEVVLPPGTPAGARWVQAGAGRDFSLALLSTGVLYGWGLNERGALGLSPSTSRPIVLPFPSLAVPGTQWQQIQAGTDHVLALLTDGSLWAWGENVYGQLAINSQADSSVPVQEHTGGTWLGISAGSVHTLAIGADGGVYGGGAAIKAGYSTNQWNDGQLGDGTLNGSLVLRRSLAVTLGRRTAQIASWKIYPNPAHEYLTIENLPRTATLQLRNALGQMLRTSIAGESRLDVRGLAGGMYWLTIATTDNPPQVVQCTIE